MVLLQIMTKEYKWLPTEKNIEDYELLKEILHSQRREFDLLSNKKAGEQLNPMKIKMVNRVLEPLKELFKYEESYKFLDTLNEDDIPTNSDVVLIISQYETAIKRFHNRYYVSAEYGYNGDFRWVTKEYPPDYYRTEESEESYDEDE